jgi:hypothetical protein
VSFLIASAAWARSTGAPAGAAGVPAEGDCTQCHGGVANSGAGNIKIELVGASSWTPGQQLRLRVTLSDPAAQRWGFQLAVRLAGNANTQPGTLVVSDSTNTQIVTSGTFQYVTHRSPGTRPGTSGSSSWEMLWNAPADASAGAVTFYAAGNAANNNGAASGDLIYATTLTVSPGAAANTTTYALPQFVFGGGWYTAIYLANSDSSAKQVTVNFLGEGGQPLNVPGLGTSSTVNVAGGGVAILEAPNSGGLTQGWATVALPSNVTGYAVFRQSVSGIADQEAVVPLSRTDSSSSLLVWDDTAYTTAVAVANPGAAQANISVTVRDSSGATIGTGSIPLAASGKTAIVLRSLPALAGMLGKRGTAQFTVSGGQVSLLGLRFNGAAFTSIPADQR